MKNGNTNQHIEPDIDHSTHEHVTGAYHLNCIGAYNTSETQQTKAFPKKTENGLIPDKKLFHIQIWRVKDVADYMGVTSGHIYNLCSRREIPFVKKRKNLYFIPKEIEDWLLQGN